MKNIDNFNRRCDKALRSYLKIEHLKRMGYPEDLIEAFWTWLKTGVL